MNDQLYDKMLIKASKITLDMLPNDVLSYIHEYVLDTEVSLILNKVKQKELSSSQVVHHPKNN